MVRIVSDTSTMYSTLQAREAGFEVSPLSVTIAGKTYREYDEINAERFVEIINEGNMPKSSQPSVGEVAALYEKYPDDQILNICMARGLSGTYEGAVAAAQTLDKNDHITVINSTTLCGPHRRIVEKAAKWAAEGLSLEEILKRVNFMIDSNKSFLMPNDFDYLRRGGRLSPMVSYVGKLASLNPVMTQTDDMLRLTVAGVKRGFVAAFKYVVNYMQKNGVDNDGEGWHISVSHGRNLETAEKAVALVKEAFPKAEVELFELSPAFITQGGPKCVAIQYVRDWKE